MLQELERQGYLPVGSSQVSRIATGHGPRVIDLVWRLSTYVIKKKLEKDFEAYTYVKAPGDSGYSNLKDFKRAPEIIAATQNIIAFKTHKFKKDCAERVGIQEQWVSFAQTITNQMQEFSHRKLEEEQTKSPATSQTKILTTLDEAERKASMEKIQRGWDSIKMFAEADWNKDGQKIIEISTEYADCRPRLNGSSMQKNNCLGVVDRKTDLPDLVGEFKNFIATAQTYLKHVDFEGFVKLADVTSEGSTINDLRRYASCTKIIMEQLQAAVVKVKSNNDLDKRETCIRLATRPTTGMINKLCPLAPQDVLTPQKLVLSTQKDQDEASLVDSLKKITMNQLSEITANCVREAARKNRAADSSQEVIMQLQDSRPADSDHIGEIDGIVARRLDYDN
uniref:AlNc14C9G1168 protein n=1 Tax=Albugo laibachii Nc14 TaxID=890382 RepID=F0W2B8_9STRA|nr:AlNc14C9G1168 [Albugo laibachii Nc14]|eukprot:CCA15203.1 AlNc14C9G1168 [Albugo laibachii Nc14]